MCFCIFWFRFHFVFEAFSTVSIVAYIELYFKRFALDYWPGFIAMLAKCLAIGLLGDAVCGQGQLWVLLWDVIIAEGLISDLCLRFKAKRVKF